jgi:hypothetical protein
LPGSSPTALKAGGAARGAAVVQLGQDDGPVRVAAHESDQHLGADPRQAEEARLVLAAVGAAAAAAGPVGGDPHPGRIGRRIRGAGAVRVLVVLRAHAGKADLHAAQGVAMDLLVARAHHDRALQLRMRQVGARVEGRHDRDPAPHGREAHAHAGGGVACARSGQRRPVGIVQQASGAHVELARQVVVGADLQLGDDEVALRHRMGVDLRMAVEGEILAGAEVAHAAFALEAFRRELVAVHAHLAQAPAVFDVVAGVRDVDQVVVQRGGQAVAAGALVGVAAAAGGHELGPRGVFIVPAVAGGDARLQAARSGPGSDGVAAVGGAVAVVAHLAGGIARQAVRVVEQHQRVRRRAVVQRVDGGGAAAAGPEQPGDAAPLEQAAHEGGVGFVVLHRLFARRELAHVEQRVEFELEGAGQHRVRVAPFVAQQLHDLELVVVAEDAAAAALFHDGEDVAQHQLVGGQAAVGVAGARFGDDAAHAAQLAAVGHELQFRRQRDEFLERQRRAAGQAGDAVVNAAADRFAADHALRQQDVVRQLARVGETQAQRAVGGAQGLLVLQDPQEFAGAVHVVSDVDLRWKWPFFHASRTRRLRLRRRAEPIPVHRQGRARRTARVCDAADDKAREPGRRGPVAGVQASAASLGIAFSALR